ncbi:MAG TPA: Crp/Fnr family transcriptional regulator [Flavobacterium sp.]|nr:Crp/Fnr family transcriptional regulator [Flavobacterium sp.]
MTELQAYLNSIAPIQQETWIRLQKLFSGTTLKKGEYFAKEGEIASKIGFLSSGVIRAFYRNAAGSEYNKHFFIANSIVGAYSSLITKEPNKINQEALTDCQLFTADYKDIEKLYGRYQDFETFGRKLAEAYFVHKEQREVEIVMLDATQRYLIFQKQFPALEQLIPQYHIASYLGITPTQLSRIRKNTVKNNMLKL